MNRENILAVADAIEKHSIPDLGFNMAAFYDTADEIGPDMSGHRCGTTACIAGWAVAVRDGGLPPLGSVNEAIIDYVASAVSFLGLGPDKYGDIPRDLMLITDPAITPSQAVSVLRHLAETGEVDWNRALAEPSK